MDGPERREFLISKGWIQVVCLVVLCGFFVLGLLVYRTYMAHPPVPPRGSSTRTGVFSSRAATSAPGSESSSTTA